MGSIDVAAKFHAQRHAAGQPDAITPASIGAMSAEATMLAANEGLAPLLNVGTYWQTETSSTAAAGYPHDGFTGSIEVLKEPTAGAAARIQRATSDMQSTQAGVWVRRYQSGVWTAWTRTDPGAVTPASIDAYPATSSTYIAHADDLLTPGLYRVSGSNLTEANGYPPIIDGTGHLRVERSINSGYIVQTVLGNTADTVWYRTRVANVWRPWTPLGPILGKGSPEGRITAPLGFVYVDQDRTNGAREWVRPSGTASGNTGWQVTEGDTGWRNVTSLIPAGILDPDAPGRLLIRRINAMVTIKADSIKPAANATSRVDLLDGTLHPNFRPSAIHEQGRFTRSNGITTFYNVTVWSSSRLGIVSRGSLTHGNVEQGWFATDALIGTVTYITDMSWPNSLPGIPA